VCRKGEPLYTIDRSIWKTKWDSLQIVKNDSAIPLLGIYSKEIKLYLKKYLYSYAYFSIIHNSQDMKTA
jgi:hypothetical protein